MQRLLKELANPCARRQALLASISAGEPMRVRILCSAISAFSSPEYVRP
jgi:hypothetical protein